MRFTSRLWTPPGREHKLSSRQPMSQLCTPLWQQIKMHSPLASHLGVGDVPDRRFQVAWRSKPDVGNVSNSRFQVGIGNVPDRRFQNFGVRSLALETCPIADFQRLGVRNLALVTCPIADSGSAFETWRWYLNVPNHRFPLALRSQLVPMGSKWI